MDESRRDFLKKAGITVIGAGAAMTGLGQGIEDVWAKANPILVGCPVPRASAYGQNGERGMLLAAEQINAAGGVRVGKVMRPLELLIADTRDEEPGVPTSEVLLSIEKLILQKKVNVLMGGPCMSECSIAAMDLYAKYKVVDLVTIGSYSPSWDQKVEKDRERYKYSFRVSGSVKWYIKEAIDLLNQLKREHKFDKMFISIDDSLMCRKAAEIVQGLAVKSGWQVVGFDKHPIASTDFSVALSECKKSGAQVLFIWAYAPETSILLRQWADMEVSALPIGFIGAAEDPGFWNQTKGKGAYTIATLSEAGNTPVSVTPKTINFYNAFLKRWRVPPRSTGCVSAYEGVYVLKDAIERAGSVEPDALVAALEKSNLPLVRGTVKFDQNHQIVYGYDPQASVLGNWVQWQDKKRITVFPQVGKGDLGRIKLPPWMKK